MGKQEKKERKYKKKVLGESKGINSRKYHSIRQCKKKQKYDLIRFAKHKTKLVRKAKFCGSFPNLLAKCEVHS